MARVLLTGGAGFIGSHVADLLLAQNHEVVILDSLDAQVHPGRQWPACLQAHIKGENPPLKLIQGDIRDEFAIRKALVSFQGQQPAEIVIHLAAQVGVGQAEYRPGPYVEANTLGTAQLLQELLRLKGMGATLPRIFVAGSMSSYGEGMYQIAGGEPFRGYRDPEYILQGGMGGPSLWDVFAEGQTATPAPISEDEPLNPAGIYAATKGQQEELVLLFGRNHGVEVVVGRLFNVYGPRQAPQNPYTGVAAIFLNRIRAGEAPIIYEDGKQARDFVYVVDVARAIVLLATTSNLGKFKAWPVFNVCTGQPTTITQLARGIARVLGRPQIEPHYPGCGRAGDVRACIGDSQKLRSLGWEPQTSLRVGLELLAEWAENQPPAETGLQERAHSELVKAQILLQRKNLPAGV